MFKVEEGSRFVLDRYRETIERLRDRLRVNDKVKENYACAKVEGENVVVCIGRKYKGGGAFEEATLVAKVNGATLYAEGNVELIEKVRRRYNLG